MQLVFHSLIFCAAALCWQPCTTPATQPLKVRPDALAGKTYRSVAARECGLGPHGPAMGHWYLRFDPIKAWGARAYDYNWDHSDVRSYGTCRLAADGQLNVSKKIKARYDPEHDRVFWDGLWYERTKDRRG